MIKTNLQIIDQLRKFLEQAGQENREEYSERKEDFTRSRKLNICRVIAFVISLPKKSLSIELGEFFENLGESSLSSCSKSAFSKARQKLKHTFFIDWNKLLVKEWYSDNDGRVKKWKGLTLLGIDGSTGYLFRDKLGKVLAYFGLHSGVVMARIMNCVDVLSGICIKGSLSPIVESEMAIARQWLEEFKRDFGFIPNPLMIYDRGFAGFAFAYLHVMNGVDFLIRYPVGFNYLVHNFMMGNERDCVVDWFISRNAIEELRALGHDVSSDTSIKVRLVKVELDTGETEVLVTSLLDQQTYKTEDFKALYFQRWGTETLYDYWKNKAQMEIVSGHSVKAILQDFYATIFTANLHSLMVNECEQQLEPVNEKRKYDYAVNKNVTLGLLKGRIVMLFLLEQPGQILEELNSLFIKHLEPVRPGRKNKRNFKRHKKGKYVTFTNYRRAI